MIQPQMNKAELRARYKSKYGTPRQGYRKCRCCGKVGVSAGYKGLLCKAKCLKELQREFYERRKRARGGSARPRGRPRKSSKKAA